MIKFGPSGNCESFYADGLKHSYQAAEWLSKKGLNAYEYSFGKGILLSDEMAAKIGEEMKKYGITISLHAPYFINFANPDDEMVEKSYGYVIDSLKKLRILGGTHLVVHPASCGKMERSEAVALTKKRLNILKDRIIAEGLDDMYVCLETMGKSAQIGTVDEILDFCTLFDHYMPTFDFGHINALTGGTLKTDADYEDIIVKCLKTLGEYRTKNVHIHFSKIEYSSKGEVKHLTLADTKYGPEFEPLARVIKKYNLEPTVICESKGIMAIDAMKLKDIYYSV
mgnify:FL=1